MENSEFVIGKLLGEGDYSKVYLCRKKESKGKFAMKVLKHSELKEKSYECETKTLSKVSHENIIKWIKSERIGNNLFVITEYFPGKTLQYVINSLKRPFKREEILPIFTPLMSGLSYLHGLNIIHGDVDVVNIMVKFGKSKNVEAVKLIDFGQSDISFSSRLVPLDPIYANDNNQVDIFSSGLVLLQMLHGNCSPEFLTKLHLQNLLPELAELGKLNPFFRNLIYGMMFDKKRLCAQEVLCFLKNFSCLINSH